MISSWPHLICSNLHPLLGPIPLPLCSRCTGIWLTLGLALLVRRRPWKREERARRFGVALLLIAAAPLHVWFSSDPGDQGRVIAGALTGAGLAVLVARPPAWSLVIAASVVLGALSRSRLVYEIYALLTPVAVLWSLGALLFLVIAPLWRKSSAEAASNKRTTAPVDSPR